MAYVFRAGVYVYSRALLGHIGGVRRSYTAPEAPSGDAQAMIQVHTQ
jgi:hypothetical protein